MNELRTTLDMGREIYVSLKCKQNDDRTLILTLLSNGVTWIPEVDSVLELRGKRSDSTVTIQTTTGITIVNNVVTIGLSKDFTRVQGTVELELNIRKLTEITTFTFTLVIEPSVMQDGALVSTNTSSLLEELTDITDWGHIHLNNAINKVVTLTKKHSQYSVGLVGTTTVVLPTVAEGEYVDIDYMFYADSELTLAFENRHISWSSYPFIQLNRRYIFNFKYIEGVWWATWISLIKPDTNLIQDIQIGWYIDETTGQQLVEPLKEHCIIDYISVNPSTSYTMSAGEIWYLRYAFYDANKVFITGVFIPGISPTKIIITPINARYIRLSLSRVNSGGNGSATSTWKFELGSIA